MSEREIELPKGWLSVRLGDFVTPQKGKKPKFVSKETNHEYLIPYVNIKAFEFNIIDEYTNGVGCVFCEDGDFLMVWDGSRSGYVGKAIKGAIGSTLVKLNFPKQVLSNYAYYYLKSKYLEINTRAKGVGIPHVDPNLVWNYKFPLPNTTVQQLIVEKIDELFSEIDKGIENLKTAQQQLKVYRQSVLKWAFEGRLTNENVKDGELPEGWDFKNFGELFSEAPQNGLYKSSSEYGYGTPIIRIDGFYDGSIVNDYDYKRVNINEAEINRYLIAVNDILINRVNSMPYLGKCGLVKALKEPTVFESNIMKIRVRREIALPQYITIYLSSRKGLQELRQNAKQAVNQASINQSDVANAIIPICDLQEQAKIIQEIENRLSVCDKIEQTIADSLQQAEMLKQSILKKAFDGKLLAAEQELVDA